MGLGTEFLLVLLLGFLILGPKQIHAKTEFDSVTRSFNSHLTVERDPPPRHKPPSA